MPAPPATVPLSFDMLGPRQARAVVLLHGFPFDRTMWKEAADQLAQAGYRVIVPDLRGHGQSPLAPEASMEAMARDVAELLEREGVPPAVIVGFSMGGYVAFQMAIRHLDRVRGLVLVDTRAEGDSEEAKKGRVATIQDVESRGMAALVDRMLPKLTHPSGGIASQTASDRLRTIMLAGNPQGAIAALKGMMSRPDVRRNLHFLKVPALVIVGEADEVTPIESAHLMAQGLPGSDIEVVKKAGHAVPLEQPQVFNALLLDFLRRLG